MHPDAATDVEPPPSAAASPAHALGSLSGACSQVAAFYHPHRLPLAPRAAPRQPKGLATACCVNAAGGWAPEAPPSSPDVSGQGVQQARERQAKDAAPVAGSAASQASTPLPSQPGLQLQSLHRQLRQLGIAKGGSRQGRWAAGAGGRPQAARPPRPGSTTKQGGNRCLAANPPTHL